MRSWRAANRAARSCLRRGRRSRHCEERSDAAIQTAPAEIVWIASTCAQEPFGGRGRFARNDERRGLVGWLERSETHHSSDARSLRGDTKHRTRISRFRVRAFSAPGMTACTLKQRWVSLRPTHPTPSLRPARRTPWRGRDRCPPRTQRAMLHAQSTPRPSPAPPWRGCRSSQSQ
jgi:hypothetical protein